MIVELLQTHKQKKKQGKKDSDVYSGGYYIAGGMLTGMLVGVLWEKLNLPGLDQEITHAILTGKELENTNKIKVDKFIMTTISSLLMLSELFGLKGGAASGSGLLMGYTYATQSRQGKYVGQT